MGKTQARQTPGITLDASALIAIDRGEKRMLALMSEALRQNRIFRVPSGVVAQAWRDGRTQVTLARFLRAHEVFIVPLDERHARACGELCRLTGTSDVIDASVVVIARKHRDVIVTGDAKDLRRLDP